MTISLRKFMKSRSEYPTPFRSGDKLFYILQESLHVEVRFEGTTRRKRHRLRELHDNLIEKVHEVQIGIPDALPIWRHTLLHSPGKSPRGSEIRGDDQAQTTPPSGTS